MQLKVAVSVFLFVAVTCCAQGDDAIDGFTEPFRKIELAPAEPGVLASLMAKEGDTVEAGQLLASLDNDVLQISLKISKQVLESHGKLAAAKAERDVRSVRLGRLQELQPKGFAHREEVDRAAADLAVAEANVLSLTEQHGLDMLEYEKAQALLERRQIRSPIAGVITKSHHDEGEYIAGNNPVVFTVVQLHPLRAVFAIPAADARSLKIDQTVTLRFPDSGQECAGRIELVSPVIDAESGLVRVKVIIPNEDGKKPCGARCLFITAPTYSLTSTTSTTLADSVDSGSEGE
ncbi:MAG TPA: efflux RND transporter periplasmic adaptor subunit [Pirellulaceae bacterium]|jgi:membrane fusion protein (multidrug efflux system)